MTEGKEKFGMCEKCGRWIDLHHPQLFHSLGDGAGYVCGECVHNNLAKRDPSVSPFPGLMRELEPHIQWRCDQAVAKFVLEQAERVTSEPHYG